MSQYSHLVCLDMDRVLVDHLSTWQFVYDKLGISNDESFELYNQGLLDEWDWIKLDIALIKNSIKDRDITDEELRTLMEGMPMMKNWHLLISELLNDGAKVAIISGGVPLPVNTSFDQNAEYCDSDFPSTLLLKASLILLPCSKVRGIARLPSGNAFTFPRYIFLTVSISIPELLLAFIITAVPA